jgi:hypothetical protein
MVISFLFSIIIFLIIVLILGQVFLWEATIWTNLSIALASIWAIFLLNAREIIRSVEILFIEIAVKILDLIAYFQGYKVGKAEGHHLEEVYKLRYKVYLESGYIEQNKEEMFLEEYDHFSTSIIAIKNNKVIGSLRVLFYNKISQLSTLDYYNVNLPKNDLYQYVDLGRWVNDPDYRSKKSKNPIVTILIGLKTYLYLLKSKKKFIIITLKHKLRLHIENIFRVKFNHPKLLPLTEQNKFFRSKFKGYFESNRDIEVCTLELKLIYILNFIFRR